MLHEKDWVLRVIKQLVELIARALKLAGEQKKDEALATLESACGTALGMDWPALALVDSASAAELLREPVRIIGFAQLLEAMGEVHERCGEPAKARSRFQHALELTCEALRRRPEAAEAKALRERLVPKVDLGLLPERYAAMVR